MSVTLYERHYLVMRLLVTTGWLLHKNATINIGLKTMSPLDSGPELLVVQKNQQIKRKMDQ